MCMQQNNGLSLPLKSIKIFVSFCVFNGFSATTYCCFVSCSAYIALVVTKPKNECRLIKSHILFYTMSVSSYVTGPAQKGVLLFFSFLFFLSSKSKRMEDCDLI